MFKVTCGWRSSCGVSLSLNYRGNFFAAHTQTIKWWDRQRVVASDPPFQKGESGDLEELLITSKSEIYQAHVDNSLIRAQSIEWFSSLGSTLWVIPPFPWKVAHVCGWVVSTDCFMLSTTFEAQRLHLVLAVPLNPSWWCFCKYNSLCRSFMNLIRLQVCVLVTQSCLILCNPMDYSPPGSSVHGNIPARILEWVAISFSNIKLHTIAQKAYPQISEKRLSLHILQRLLRDNTLKLPRSPYCLKVVLWGTVLNLLKS